MKNLIPITNSRALWNYTCLFTLVVYSIGLFVPLMEPDAAVYAEVAREMYQNDNWLEIYKKDKDWLDKPHFQFWITAFSYKLFGVNAFAYKLPAVLFILLAAWYTYLFGKRFYSRMHGFFAALLLITAQHIIISNSDVRAEAYLTGLTILALYHITAWLQEKQFLHLVAGSAGMACLIMTKGLFTIIPVASGVFFALLYKQQWKEIFSLRWILCMLMVLVFIFPSLYGHYIQFDLHPEKEISGQKNVSGVKYFLWGSQWGRYTSTRPIAGKGEPLFFFHTLLWAYAPWALLGFFALFQKTRQLILRNTTRENYTYFGFVTLFTIFAFSRFQLSYYLNALFPLLSIMTAETILRLARNKKLLKIFTRIQLFQCLLLIIILLLLHNFFSGNFLNWDTILILVAGFGIPLYLLLQKNSRLKKIIFVPAFVVLTINYYINREFYPKLLGYQSESNVARFIQQNNLPADKLICLDLGVIITDVLLQRVIPDYKIDQANSPELEGKLIFTTKNGLQRIQSLGKAYKVLSEFDDFPLTKLSLPFLNKKTRQKTLGKNYLVQME